MQAATGLDWNPGIAGPGGTDEATGAELGADLGAKIKTQGHTIKKLKTEKADKASIDAALNPVVSPGLRKEDIIENVQDMMFPGQCEVLCTFDLGSLALPVQEGEMGKAAGKEVEEVLDCIEHGRICRKSIPGFSTLLLLQSSFQRRP